MDVEGKSELPGAMHSGSNGASFKKATPLQVKEEPKEALAQCWEAQCQEFLRTVESPHSSWGNSQVPEQRSPWDNAKAFLASFEQVAEACCWPKEEWAARLLLALKGEAQQAFRRLEAGDREDYGKVKAAILHRDIISREINRLRFRCFCYEEAEGPRGAYNQLQELCLVWLKVEGHTREHILELLVLEQFLAILPPEIQNWVKERGSETCSQAVALAEDFLLGQRDLEREGKQVAMEEAQEAVSSFEIDQVLADEQRQLHTETKQEDNYDQASLLGNEWMTTGDGQKPVQEDSSPVGLHSTPMWKVEENISRCFEEKNVFPVPCRESDKAMTETAVRTGTKAGSHGRKSESKGS